MTTRITTATAQDCEVWVSMAQKLWPDAKPSELSKEFLDTQSKFG